RWIDEQRWKGFVEPALKLGRAKPHKAAAIAPGLEGPFVDDWKRARDQLAMAMDASAFQSWIAELVLIEIDGKTLKLSAASPFKRDFVRANHLGAIERAARRSVEIVVERTSI